jgi:hypothetical protein
VDFAVVEDRRVDARFGTEVLASSRATVRPGCTVTIIDLSAGGALVQAGRPLRPGARVHLQFQRGSRRFALAAHIQRCAVWALDADHGVMYRAGLQFEHRCHAVWEAERQAAEGRPTAP